METTYNKALYNTIFLLQLRIYKLFNGGKSQPPTQGDAEGKGPFRFDEPF